MMELWQIEIIREIQRFRGPFTDSFFLALNFFDTLEFFFILIPTVWLLAGWKVGLRFFYLMVASGLLNFHCKEFFSLHRPVYFAPELAMVKTKTFGFPSGAAQTAIIFSGLLISYLSKYRGIFAALLYTLLISFSRIYLGVHFFTDILGGWVLGSSLWLLYSYFQSRYTNYIETASPYVLASAHLLLFIALLAGGAHTHFCLLAIGVGLGLAILTRLGGEEKIPSTPGQRIGILAWGLGGMMVIELINAAVLSSLGDWARIVHFIILGIWLCIAGRIWANFQVARDAV